MFQKGVDEGMVCLTNQFERNSTGRVKPQMVRATLDATHRNGVTLAKVNHLNRCHFATYHFHPHSGVRVVMSVVLKLCMSCELRNLMSIGFIYDTQIVMPPAVVGVIEQQTPSTFIRKITELLLIAIKVKIQLTT